MIVVPDASMIAIAADVKTNVLDGGSLRLFQNDVTPDGATILADLTIANFTGYANHAIATWADPYVDANGDVVSLGGLATFTATGSGTANTVYGAYYLDAGGDLVWAARFDAPIPIAAAGNTIAFVPRFTYARSA